MTTAERPMLFSAPMVQAILAGRKTQTRRVAKPRRQNSLLSVKDDGDHFWGDSYILDPGNVDWLMAEAPAKAGETMYVREAFRFNWGYDDRKPTDVPQMATVFYEADGPARPGTTGKLRPGIHMPRWASRIERAITDVRLERLNACSEADAWAEGLACLNTGEIGIPTPEGQPWIASCEGPVDAYRALWEHINGPGSWAANPLVWVITFEGGKG